MSKNTYKTSGQGSLDGLCGIYSIINSCGLMLGKPLTHHDQVEVFCRLTSLLDDGRSIGYIVHEGIGFRKLGELIDVASRMLVQSHGMAIHRSVAWKSGNGNLEKFWEDMKAHVDPAEGRVALIGICGKHDHWTVVKKVYDNRLKLADSDGLGHLNKSHCALTDDNTHQLQPTQTYLLRMVEAPDPDENFE